jgi:hypothetical protein
VIKEPWWSDEALQTQEFTVHDPDGYVVGIGDRSRGWLANSGLKLTLPPPTRAQAFDLPFHLVSEGDFNLEHTRLGDLLGRLTASPQPPIRYWHI